MTSCIRTNKESPFRQWWVLSQQADQIIIWRASNSNTSTLSEAQNQKLWILQENLMKRSQDSSLGNSLIHTDSFSTRMVLLVQSCTTLLRTPILLENLCGWVCCRTKYRWLTNWEGSSPIRETTSWSSLSNNWRSTTRGTHKETHIQQPDSPGSKFMSSIAEESLASHKKDVILHMSCSTSSRPFSSKSQISNQLTSSLHATLTGTTIFISKDWNLLCLENTRLNFLKDNPLMRLGCSSLPWALRERALTGNGLISRDSPKISWIVGAFKR
jgi:hypothetical protein